MPLRLRRALSLTVDLLVLAVILIAVARFLPEGPPPLDAMAFFSQQDFKNYFTLVLACIVLSALRVLPFPGTSRTLSLGDLIFKLKLLHLDGTRISAASRAKRWAWGLLPLALVLIPGPIISLVLGAAIAQLTNSVLTTPADVMDRAGFPGWLSYTLHGLSFAALGAALLYLVLLPAMSMFRREASGAVCTPLDRRSGTTHFSDA
jgi:hypothetical protein